MTIWRCRLAAILITLIAAFIVGAPSVIAADRGAGRAAEIDAFVSRYHEFGLFNGTILVGDSGNVIYKKGFGLANMEWDIPNKPDGKFRLGSITKQFTAALILQLAAKGKIDLKAPIGTYLADYPKPTADKVTIHNLLTHTSGIPNYTSIPSVWEALTRDPYKPLDFVKIFSGEKLEFEPGSKFKYSNSGYFLLGVVIEAITGLTCEEALRERIFKPLRMHDSGYDHHQTRLAKRAGAYQSTLDGYVNAGYLDMSVPYAAGALYSTVEDLYKWDQALYTEKVLPDKYTRTMFKGHVKVPHPRRSMDYGYGWFIEAVKLESGDDSSSARALRAIGHGGGINGFQTLIQRIPEERHLIVLLNNTGGARLEEMTDGIRAVLYGMPTKLPKRPLAPAFYKMYQQQGLDAAIEQYHKLKSEEPQAFDFDPNELTRVGRHLAEKKRTDDAIEVFKVNAEAHPKHAGTYMGLGDAYRMAGKKKLAIQNYAKALELNPDSAAVVVDIIKNLSEN